MKLTTEQLKLYEALTPLQKKCVDIKITNPTLSNAECYRRANMIKYDNGDNKKYSDRYAFALFNREPVKAFLKSMEVETIDDMIMGREEMLADLTDIANAKLEDVIDLIHTDDNMMNVDTGEIYTGVESITVKRLSEIPEHVRKAIKSIEQTRYGIKVTLHDPLAARKMLADMQGFNAPVKQEVKLEGPTTLSDFYGNTESES
jgi:phage terminase small subunit